VRELGVRTIPTSSDDAWLPTAGLSSPDSSPHAE